MYANSKTILQVVQDGSLLTTAGVLANLSYFKLKYPFK